MFKKEKKKFTNEPNMSLPLQARVEETVHEIETNSLSGKEKVPGTAISKEHLIGSHLKYERDHHYQFLEKGASVKSISYCQLL